MSTVLRSQKETGSSRTVWILSASTLRSRKVTIKNNLARERCECYVSAHTWLGSRFNVNILCFTQFLLKVKPVEQPVLLEHFNTHYMNTASIFPGWGAAHLCSMVSLQVMVPRCARRYECSSSILSGYQKTSRELSVHSHTVERDCTLYGPQ